jgi:hypothetical protein
MSFDHRARPLASLFGRSLTERVGTVRHRHNHVALSMSSRLGRGRGDEHQLRRIIPMRPYLPLV